MKEIYLSQIILASDLFQTKHATLHALLDDRQIIENMLCAIGYAYLEPYQGKVDTIYDIVDIQKKAFKATACILDLDLTSFDDNNYLLLPKYKDISLSYHVATVTADGDRTTGQWLGTEELMISTKQDQPFIIHAQQHALDAIAHLVITTKDIEKCLQSYRKPSASDHRSQFINILQTLKPYGLQIKPLARNEWMMIPSINGTSVAALDYEFKASIA